VFKCQNPEKWHVIQPYLFKTAFAFALRKYRRKKSNFPEGRSVCTQAERNPRRSWMLVTRYWIPDFFISGTWILDFLDTGSHKQT